MERTGNLSLLPRRWELELTFGTVYTVSLDSGGSGGAAWECEVREVRGHWIFFLQPWVSLPLHRGPLAMVRIPMDK